MHGDFKVFLPCTCTHRKIKGGRSGDWHIPSLFLSLIPDSPKNGWKAFRVTFLVTRIGAGPTSLKRNMTSGTQTFLLQLGMKNDGLFKAGRVSRKVYTPALQSPALI